MNQARDAKQGKDVNQVITISADLKLLTVYNDPIVVHIMPEVWDPYHDKVLSRVYGMNKNKYFRFKDFELSTGKKTRPAVRYKKQILIPTYSMANDDGLEEFHTSTLERF